MAAKSEKITINTVVKVQDDIWEECCLRHQVPLSQVTPSFLGKPKLEGWSPFEVRLGSTISNASLRMEAWIRPQNNSDWCRPRS